MCICWCKYMPYIYMDAHGVSKGVQLGEENIFFSSYKLQSIILEKPKHEFESEVMEECYFLLACSGTII